MVNMALRQHLLVFSLLLLVTVGHSYSMKYILDRLNALETKFEIENNRIRLEMEALATKFETENKLRYSETKSLETKSENENNRTRLEMEALGTKFETENKLRHSETKSLEINFENENNRIRLEMEALGTKFETENKLRHSETKSLETKFENENKVRRSETEALFKKMSEITGGDSRANNHEQVKSDEIITLAQLLMITSPSMDKLKTTDLARFVRSLINGFAVEKEENVKLRSELKSISRQMETEKAKFESRINERIRNLTNDVFDKQSSQVSVEKFNNFTANFSEMKQELRQSLDLIKSDVEKSVLELSSNIRVLNKTALETTGVVRSLINGFAFEKGQNVKLRLELKFISEQMETDKDKFESRLNEIIRNVTSDVSNTQKLLACLETFNNFTAFLTETTTANFSEMKQELKQSLDSIKSDVEKSVFELTSNIRVVNKTALETTRVVGNLIYGSAVKEEENVKLRSELKSISRQIETEKAKFESRINERIRNLTNDVFDKQSSLVSVEKFNNFTAFLTETTTANFSEMKQELRQSLDLIKSDVDKSVLELSSNIRVLNKTTLETTGVVRSLINSFAFEREENVKLRLELKSISGQMETEKAKFESRINERIRNFTNDVFELTSYIRVMSITAFESVERCNNISDSLTMLTSTALSEVKNETRQSLITYKSDVEILFRGISDGLRIVNQTSLECAERCKNVSDTSTALSEVNNEWRQSLISYKSYVEFVFRDISNVLRTVNQTFLKETERCNQISDSLTMLTSRVLLDVRNESSHSVISYKPLILTAAAVLCHLRNESRRSQNANETCIQELLNSISPTSCKSAAKRNGVHFIYVETLIKSIAVYCDQTTDGGGWIIFQRRKDGSEDFHRTWNDYKVGFGNLEGEFWLGNDILHALTSAGYNELRIDMEDFKGNKAYAKYSYFKVKSEREKYTLEVSGYSGNAKDSLSEHSGTRFVSKDRDNDNKCSSTWKGAWWFIHCHPSNLNGVYYRDDNHAKWEGIIWVHWQGSKSSLKFVEMKVR